MNLIINFDLYCLTDWLYSGTQGPHSKNSLTSEVDTVTLGKFCSFNLLKKFPMIPEDKVHKVLREENSESQ